MAPPTRLLHPSLLAATARTALLSHAAPVERPHRAHDFGSCRTLNRPGRLPGSRSVRRRRSCSGARRTAPFLVVLTAPWTGTDESTRNQLGVGPGHLVLVVQFGPVAWPGPSTSARSGYDAAGPVYSARRRGGHRLTGVSSSSQELLRIHLHRIWRIRFSSAPGPLRSAQTRALRTASGAGKGWHHGHLRRFPRR